MNKGWFMEEINQYSCDEIFFSRREEILNLRSLKYQYDEFVSDLEYFFNGQVKDNDIHLFKGEIFELSDVAEDFFFPFRTEDGKLKFVENESWRTLIMASLLLTRIHHREMR